MKTALGNFTYDKEFKCYNAFVDWNGQNTDVAILECKSEEEALKAAEALSVCAQDMAGFDADARSFAAQKLLEQANVTLDAFVSALTMIGISVFPGGETEIYYADGDLFGGQAVLVSRNADGSFRDASVSD